MAHGSIKKRKQADGLESQKKKKRVSVDSAKSSKLRTVKVSSIIRPQVSPPIIATVPGISLTKDAVFNSYSRAPPPSKRSRNAAQDDLLLHSSSHRTLDYTAREDKPKGGDPLLKHYVGVFDPASGQLELVEARKMVVRGVVRSQQAPEEDMRAQTISQTMFDLRTELGQAFGTKKSKKAIAAVTENAIAPRKRTGDGSPEKLDASEMALMETIKDVTLSVPTREALQLAIDAAKPVPRGNYEADEIQDVYVPDQIIGKDILELIQVKDWIQAVKMNEAIQVRSRFVANRVNRLGSGNDAVARLRLLRYLLFLIQFLMTAKQGKERGTKEILKKDKLKDALYPAPPPVIENIRRKFSDQGIIRKQHVDLLMTHCCAFACILDNFETNTWDLKEDFQLEQKQINQYFMEIGARTKKAKIDGKNENLCVLKLPLLFPKVRVGRRS